MTNYEKLVEALRILQDKNSLSYYKRQVCKDAADAIEKLVTLYEKAEMDATNLTGKLAQAEAEVERLKDSNEELREKQTYIDHYGAEWMTSAKDVPTAAYEHGYADGRDEAMAKMEAHPCYWNDVKTSVTEIGIDTFRGKTSWAKRKFQRVTHWMEKPKPPKEDA